MIIPADLLDFAVQEVLSAEINRRPETVARRALSACYYYLSHTLADAGASLFDGSDEQRARLARSFDHSSFGSAAREIERRQTPRPGPNLVALASCLRRLREARERADYDLKAAVTWDDAGEMVSEALHASNLIHFLRSDPEMNDFLLSALVGSRRRG